MAVPAPAGSLPGPCQLRRSSLTGPAIGQLRAAAQALDGERARLLPVLAAVPILAHVAGCVTSWR